MSKLVIQKNIPLAPLTTFGIGGAAEFFTEVHSEEELTEAAQWAKKYGHRMSILGGGSNVLITDVGIEGLVVHMNIDGIEYTEGDDTHVLATVGAGVSWDELVATTVEKELWGIENLSGIPGTVGGAVVQNINAYGVTIGTRVVSVETVHIPTRTQKTFQPDECMFSYRNSFFKELGVGKEYVITKVRLSLSKKTAVHATYKSASQSMQSYFEAHHITEPTPEDVRQAILEIRTRIGMVEGAYKSAGSFFINPIVSEEVFKQVLASVEEKFRAKSEQYTPWYWVLDTGEVKISAAFLMECTPYNKTAFIGKTFNGTVGISPLHTLSLVNCGNATASDVEHFAKEIVAAVQKEFGVTLTSEISFLS